MIYAGIKPETDIHMVKEARECAAAMERYSIERQAAKKRVCDMRSGGRGDDSPAP
jgi:hypothetical protein